MGRHAFFPRREAGFTYLGLIVLLTIIGLVGAATLKVESLLRRAAAEQELLEIGAAFSAALKSYAEATPRGQPPQPPSLRELLKDPRVPGIRRHLRKIFVDPSTGKAEWGIVWANAGNQTGVLAVYSLSKAAPLKVANFDARFPNFENKEHLSDWKFASTGQALSQAGQGQVPIQPPQAQGQPSLFPDQQAQPAPGQASLFPGRGEQPRPSPVEPPAAPAEPPAEATPPPEKGSDGRDEKDGKGEKDSNGEKDERDGERDPREPPPSNESR